MRQQHLLGRHLAAFALGPRLSHRLWLHRFVHRLQLASGTLLTHTRRHAYLRQPGCGGFTGMVAGWGEGYLEYGSGGGDDSCGDPSGRTRWADTYSALDSLVIGGGALCKFRSD